MVDELLVRDYRSMKGRRVRSAHSSSDHLVRDETGEAYCGFPLNWDKAWVSQRTSDNVVCAFCKQYYLKDVEEKAWQKKFTNTNPPPREPQLCTDFYHAFSKRPLVSSEPIRFEPYEHTNAWYAGVMLYSSTAD